MRVRADGNDFSAQLTISGQNLPAGIGLRKAVGQAAAVALDALPMFNQAFEHLVDDRSVPVIVVEAVRAWGVADDVVQMTVHVKTGPETADSLQGNSKKIAPKPYLWWFSARKRRRMDPSGPHNGWSQ